MADSSQQWLELESRLLFDTPGLSVSVNCLSLRMMDCGSKPRTFFPGDFDRIGSDVMDELEAQDNLSVKRGERFSVELRNYSGGGALWGFVLPEGIELIEKTTKPLDEGIGGEVLQVFTFRADAAGSSRLVFELKRPWEPAARRRKTITVKVE